MRKIAIPLIACAAVLLAISTAGCKKANLDISWSSLQGSGYYHTQDNTSSITVNGVVHLQIPQVATDPMWAEIYSWRYVITAGNVVVLDINSDNYLTALGDITLDISDRQSSSLWVSIETTTPKTFDIYDGDNPDTVTLILEVLDSSGNTYTLSNSAAFDFSRD
jgi:UDP-N-acetylglucosamine enolpyruvyl transferase